MAHFSALTVFAALPVRDLAAATQFYAALFGREPDGKPSVGIAEWYLVDADVPERGTLQLRVDPGRAGGGLVTVNVADLGPVSAAAAARNEPLETRTFPIEAEAVSAVTVAEVIDPDGNAITFVQPHLRT